GVIFAAGVQTPLADPGFDIGAAPGGVDETDGDIQRLVQLSAKEIADCGERGDRGRAALFPMSTFYIVFRPGADRLVDGEKPDAGIVGIPDLFVGVIDPCPAGYGEFHVRLSAAYPHVAYEDVGEANRVAGARDRPGVVRVHGRPGVVPARDRRRPFPARDLQRIGAAVRHGGKGRAPGAFVIGYCSPGLAAEGDLYFLAGAGPAPDGHRCIALED